MGIHATFWVLVQTEETKESQGEVQCGSSMTRLNENLKYGLCMLHTRNSKMFHFLFVGDTSTNEEYIVLYLL